MTNEIKSLSKKKEKTGKQKSGREQRRRF